MAEQWLSIVEYARTYSVSDMTVRRRIKTGKLHAVLKEGKYYIPVAVENGGSSRTGSREPSSSSQRSNAREASPRRADIAVVKSHPGAQKTYPAMAPSAVAHDPSHAALSRAASSTLQMFDDTDVTPGFSAHSILAPDSPIPQSVRAGVEQRAAALVDTRALLAFCDGSLRSASAAEKRVEELFRHRFDSLSQQLKAKDVEINSLRQQLEDMQLLVQILEKKRP